MRRGVILAVACGFSYSESMPYLFPYEDLFVGGVVFMILGLLLVRAVVAKKQRGKDVHRTDL